MQVQDSWKHAQPSSEEYGMICGLCTFNYARMYIIGTWSASVPLAASIQPSSRVCGDGREEDTQTKTSVGPKRNTLRSTGGGTGPSLGKHAMRRGNRRKCGCFPPPAHPLQDTLKSKPKPTRMIPSMKPTSQTVKGPICEIHFGVRPLFAFSGVSKTDAAPYATRESPASPDGGFTTAFPW